MIHTYKINNQAYKIYGVNNVISKLSRVNIFVGANNSGKSRLLRHIFAEKNDQFLMSEIDLPAINDLIESLKCDINSAFNSSGGPLSDAGEIVEKVTKLTKLEWITRDALILKPLADLLNHINQIIVENNGNNPRLKLRSTMTAQGGQHLWEKTKPQIISLHNTYSKKFYEQTSSFKTDSKYDFNKIYIPTLRGLRNISSNGDSKSDQVNWNQNIDIFALRTGKDYFNGAIEGVFTGLKLYDEITDLLLGDLEQRDIVARFQTFLSESFFDGENVLLIPKRKHDVLNVRIGHEEKPIYDLGDGIQSLIILTFPLFLYENKKTLVFIEEPEHYLHPGMQRKFLQTLYHFNNHQFFITTHSNHLLDLTLDFAQISVYKFMKNATQSEEPIFTVENISNEDTSVLALLGVQNSAVMLSNCTIWVEGITDRLYLRKYLDLYQKSVNDGKIPLKEDVHYSFVEYGGGNITHWSFLDDDSSEFDRRGINVDRVCSRLFLIADSDGGKKDNRLKQLQQKLVERFYQLPCREIENLLSVSTLKRVIASYENLPVDQIVFKKPKFTEKDYENKLLGQFIESQLTSKRRKGSYKADSGTVSRKTDFCHRALNNISSFSDMSHSAVELCEGLYKFIQGCNL